MSARPVAPKGARSEGEAEGTPVSDVRRKEVMSMVLEPGTGKALELRKGQILRVEQIEGGQCADFNCFNLHDYKESMHTGRTRTLHGIWPTQGHFMWSAPPRERAMMYILEDTVGCNDVMFPRCSANVYESLYGLPVHTNCHDIQAEAQREYGLTPDDVHDSFNLFMKTGVRPDGSMFIERHHSVPGDHVDLLALMDVLAVPNVCGSDVMRTSNFAIKPLRVRIFEATEADWAQVPTLQTWRTQRTPADFRNSRIKVERALQRDPDYRPEFTNVPIVYQDHAITLDDEELALLRRHAQRGLYGDDDGLALRDIVFAWWEQQFLGRD